MASPHPSQTRSFETLGIEVEGVKADVRDLKDGLIGLRAGVDETMSRFITETRSALTSLSDKIGQGKITPWATIFGAMTIVMAILAAFGSQSLAPLTADIKKMQGDIVPRDEILSRSEAANRHLLALDAQVHQLEQRRYDELLKTVERLTTESNAWPAATIADHDARISGAVRRLERLEGPPPARSRILGDQ